MRQSRAGLHYSICNIIGLEKFITAAFVPVHCVVTLEITSGSSNKTDF